MRLAQNAANPKPRRRGWLRWFTRRRRPEPREWKYWQTHLWPHQSRPDKAFIVHGKCADGFTSGALLLHEHPKGMVLYVQPTEFLVRLQHAVRRPPRKLLVIADVAPQTFEAEQVVALLAQIALACRVVWIDHHAPQWAPEFEARIRKVGVEVVLDRTEQESGASLVARWAGVTNKGLLRVADLIRRRDTWTDPHNPAARAWSAVAGARRREYVERVADANLDGLEEEGMRIIAEKDLRVEWLVAEKVQGTKPGVRWQWSEDDVSDVADRVFREQPGVNVFLRFGTTGNVSVRSRTPVAAELAQTFGGGGHANAAGFNLQLRTIARWRYLLLRGRDRVARRVRRHAQLLAERSETGEDQVTVAATGPAEVPVEGT